MTGGSLARHGLGGTIVSSWKGATWTLASRPVALLAVATVPFLMVVDHLFATASPKLVGAVAPSSVGATTLADAVRVLLCVPLLIAVYRRRLMRGSVRIRPDGRALVLFAGWSVAFFMAISLPELVASVIGLPRGLIPLAGVPGLYLQLRLILVPPAASLGLRHAASLSWRATRHRFWWVLIGNVVTIGPGLLLELVLLIRSGHPVPLAVDLLTELVGVLVIVLDAAFAAQLFADTRPMSQAATP